MEELPPNNHHLENLLLTLAEYPLEKNHMLPLILEQFPWGHHPSLLIEKIGNPEHRMMIRDNIARMLILEKQKADLYDLLRHPETDHFTEKGAFIFTYFSDDVLYSYNEFSKILDDLARPLLDQLNELTQPSESLKIRKFIQYFFHDLDFSGNTDTPLDLDNYLIHKVLEKRKGGAIMLCILANSIAGRAGIQLPIVITAGHFLLRTSIDREIPFIDPYLKGRIITEYEHMNIVATKGYDPSISLVQIDSPVTLFRNLARNLVQVAQAAGDKNLLASAREVREILKEWDQQQN